MDMRTGETYESVEAARKAGVPISDIAEIRQRPGQEPEVRFPSGPFKDRVYKRNAVGQLARVR
jgi:hypothetical protein